MHYTFKKTDSGIFGNAFEMAVKDALNRKHADRVSPAGVTDFIFNRKHYDTKQNGTVLRYCADWGYIRGSRRVLYASHIAYRVIEETETTITIEPDLLNTEIFVLDRQEFIDFLLFNGYAKENKSRGTINIQTGYNYKKDAYHGRVGRNIEEWAREHEIDDDIVTLIYDALC